MRLIHYRRFSPVGFILLLMALVVVSCSVGESRSNLTDADLTALRATVRRNRPPEAISVGVDERVPVQEGDRVEVDLSGRALLRFQDRLRVELFRDTEAIVSNVQLEPGGFIFVRLKQTFGHSRTSLKSLANARVTVETDYATIQAVGTEFLVCHGKALTCLVTLEGETEVEAQGKVIVVPAGEATYVFPGQPPQPLICAKMDEVNQWLDLKRGTEEVGALGALVAKWPPVSCSPAASSLPATPATTLPSKEGMVRIEGGAYEVGSPTPDDYHLTVRNVKVAKFWIDQYEVTNAQFKAFLDTTTYQAPAGWSGKNFPPGQGDHPVKGVAWDQAAAYCTWTQKRLPTEAEWEVAARGPGPKPPLYPWGSDPQAGGKVAELPLTDTYQVGTYAFNKSPFGVYDMAGNIWERVGEPYSPVTGGNTVLRGGRYGLLRDMAYRLQVDPNNELYTRVAGFRCAAERVAGE